MLIKRFGQFGAVLTMSAGISAGAFADLTQQLVDEFNAGTRSIRAEVTSLKTVAVPEPSNLYDFVKNKKKAIELGKALFWDMQVGSDGIQACASCHFNAGADSRAKNQTSPGLLRSDQFTTNQKDTSFDKGANYHISAADFPVHEKANRIRFDSAVVKNTNDIISSQGVHYSTFVDAKTGQAVDTTTPAADPDNFQVTGVNTRRVEPRNTPTVINAVFNHRQFWDGRAFNIFNGVNPAGDLDPDAVVYKMGALADDSTDDDDDDWLVATKVRIDHASLASQAVGPPLSPFEMSADGRYWMEIGDKFILSEAEKESNEAAGVANTVLRPLALQKVDQKDSVLGQLAKKGGTGLNVKDYAKMIKKAFKKDWWDAEAYVQLNADGSRSIISEDDAEVLLKANPDANVYSHMEANFSLIFGLAVQMYEATLVSDDSPVDRFLEGDKSALTDQELAGFLLADGGDMGRCINCHGRGEFTYAAVSRVDIRGETRIRKGDLIEEGFNNIGVTPTLEDLGVGGGFSYARQTHLGLFDNAKIANDANNDPAAELSADLGVDGAFKIPTLRNVALTGPYFHNGGESTLEDVVDFYLRGGNFRTFNSAENHPIIGYTADRSNDSKITGLGILRSRLVTSGPGLDQIALDPDLTDEQVGFDDVDRDAIVAFLKALTDERVKYRKAPFDHPQLFVPNGHAGDETMVTADANGKATDSLLKIPAVGAAGGTQLPTFNDNLAP